MKRVELTVNARPVSADVEPRLQLADFLREHLTLTGTHLGCEHGVCGACTIELDGAPARSCIAYTVACDGSQVRTIEGFDGDALMAELREAFSAEHALQCGYCTPGMLITARDIVLRLPEADETRIRQELAGNLCRCTGYVGIVRAIQRVLARRAEQPGALPVSRGTPTGIEETPAGAPVPPRPQAGARRAAEAPRATERDTVATLPPAGSANATVLRESFTVPHPRDAVWSFFGRLDAVAACLPGTRVIDTPAADRVHASIRVRAGPVVAEFEGTAEAKRDPSAYTGTISGSARDARSSSTTRGEIRYALAEADRGAATRIDVDVSYTLAGPLAQFGRSTIARDIARRMTAAFAQNLEARLGEGDRPGAATRDLPAQEIDAGSLLFSALRARVKAFFRRLRGR